MSDAPIPWSSDAGTAFLRALATRIGVRMVAYVPVNGRSQVLWAAADADLDTELVPLERRGRASSPPDTDTGADVEPQFALAPVRSAVIGRLGTVVAVKQTARAWTSPERALVQFLADFYGPDLDLRATPPPETAARDVTRATSYLESGMRDAIDNGELSLVYQPEVDLRTQEIIAVEALVRWQHRTLGELGPDSFITLAEHSDLIKQLGAWVIDESIRVLGSWTADIPNLDIMLRINVSPIQLDDDLITSLEAALRSRHVSGRQLCLELTENAPMQDLERVSQVLRRLSAMGITTAIDDLASGYSSLSRLRHLPVDVVKIDRSLITGIDSDPRARIIVAAVVGLARQLQIGVVAEGVETEAEHATLLGLGCTRGQGHRFGRPMREADARAALRGAGADRRGDPTRDG